MARKNTNPLTIRGGTSGLQELPAKLQALRDEFPERVGEEWFQNQVSDLIYAALCPEESKYQTYRIKMNPDFARGRGPRTIGQISIVPKPESKDD